MNMTTEPARAHWSSNIGFLLSAMGAAIGLGSVWKFPYMVGTGGGGAFVLIYLLAAATITIPILIGELMLGRRGQASAPNTMSRIAAEVGGRRGWRWLGIVTVVNIYLIGSYYSVIGGWIFAYVFKSASGSFAGASKADVARHYNELMADPWAMTFWHVLFMALTVVVLMGGVRQGIERASRWMMPILFVMLIILVMYAAVFGDFASALTFLFVPDFSAVDARLVLGAVSLSFFSIGTGMAMMMTYGSYLTKDMSVSRSAIKVALTVPIVALAMGLAIFPVVFAHGLDPASGPGLLFQTLPLGFSSMTGGVVFGTLFFILVSFSALISAIAGIEPIVAWLEEGGHMSRRSAAFWSGLVAALLGLATVFSFNIWKDIHLLAGIGQYGSMTLFDLLDFVTGNIIIPLSNILLCIFVGWVLPATFLKEELTPQNMTLFAFWRATLRYFAPIPIAIVLIMGL
jgi:neurotransmitter:Na+ symporter, NSS family